MQKLTVKVRLFFFILVIWRIWFLSKIVLCIVFFVSFCCCILIIFHFLNSCIMSVCLSVSFSQVRRKYFTDIFIVFCSLFFVGSRCFLFCMMNDLFKTSVLFLDTWTWFTFSPTVSLYLSLSVFFLYFAYYSFRLICSFLWHPSEKKIVVLNIEQYWICYSLCDFVQYSYSFETQYLFIEKKIYPEICPRCLCWFYEIFGKRITLLLMFRSIFFSLFLSIFVL